MPVETIAPYVYIEEVQNISQPISGVTTSTMGIVGYAQKGPANKATLVGGISDYTKKFGGYTTQSVMTHEVQGFFDNGGTRTQVVRVPPADAVAATVKVQSRTEDQAFETGDGATATFTKTNLTTLLKANNGASPLVPNAFSFRWRGSKSAAVVRNLKDRDLTSTADVTAASGPDYELRVDPRAEFRAAVGGYDLRIRSHGDGRRDIQVALVAGGPQVPTVTVSGKDITVSYDDTQNVIGGPLDFTTAAQIASAINGDLNTSALVVATGSSVNGTGDSIAGVGAQVLTDAAGAFTAAMIGQYISILGATTGSNNGTHVITAVGGTTVSYTNTNTGVAEAFSGTYSINGPIPASALAPLVGGTPSFDQALDRIVPSNSTVLAWTGGSARTLKFPKALGSLTDRIYTINMIAYNASLDGLTFVVDDGVTAPVTFEFDDDATFTPGNIPVTIAALDTAPDIADAIASAIATTSLHITATAYAANDRVYLTHDDDGVSVAEAIVFTDVGGLIQALDPEVTFGTSFQFDHKSGFMSLHTEGYDDGVSGFMALTYTPTWGGYPGILYPSDDSTYFVASDDGAGALQSTGGFDIVPTLPTVTYATGAYYFETLTIFGDGSFIPYDGGPLLATYDIYAWAGTASSVGTWGNSLQLQITPDIDYEDVPTSTYSKYNALVVEYDETVSPPAVLRTETYANPMDMADEAAADFWVDVINAGSSLIQLVSPGGNEAPGQLNGVARVDVLGGGSGSQTFNTTLVNAPIAENTLVISYVSAVDSEIKTIVGTPTGLSGSIDPAGTTSFNKNSGAIQFKTLDAIKPGTLVVATYSSSPTATVVSEDFGEVSRAGVAGEDGTFDSVNWGYDQFINPTLSAQFKGYYALNKVDDLLQVVVPDWVNDVPTTKQLIAAVETRANQPSGQDRFLLLSTPLGMSAEQARDWYVYTLATNTIHAAMYWPWINIFDPLSKRSKTIPALGAIAGCYARTDLSKNVGKNPAGTVDGKLNNILGLELADLSLADMEIVYPRRINPLFSSIQTGGPVVWGVRTMAGPGRDEWKYINARRVFNFLEKSVFNSTFWIVFENNGPGLWARIKAQLDSFLGGVYSQGILRGSSPNQAFKVVVDTSNNTPETINNGEVIIDVGVAINKPAEFVKFRFTQLIIS